MDIEENILMLAGARAHIKGRFLKSDTRPPSNELVSQRAYLLLKPPLSLGQTGFKKNCGIAAVFDSMSITD